MKNLIYFIERLFELLVTYQKVKTEHKLYFERSKAEIGIFYAEKIKEISQWKEQKNLKTK